MENFIAYIEEKTEQLQQEEKNLIASERKDEGNLVKIRINVVGICRTYFEVVQKNTPAEQFPETYLQRIDALAQTWKTAYEKAKEHQDIEKKVIEEIKLEMLEEVKGRFRELVGKQ